MILQKFPRRAVWTVLLGLGLACCALAQEAKPEAASSEPSLGWQVANFVLLAIALGYLLGKNLPPLFQKQSSDIQAAIREAAKVKEGASAHAAGIEARLANLESEVEKLRVSARADMAAEGDRIKRETENHLQRIREQTAQEMELLTRSAKDELRKYSAELSIGLAEQRIRSRMNPAAQQGLTEAFLHDLHERGIRQAAN